MSNKEQKIEVFKEMTGAVPMKNRGYVLKRFNADDIYISKDERDILEKAILNNLKFVRLGLFTIILSTVSAIEPREGIY